MSYVTCQNVLNSDAREVTCILREVSLNLLLYIDFFGVQFKLIFFNY